jgi:uncharacterized protein (DUF1697 family)
VPVNNRHVALLRAVNVGGRNLVAMAGLRELFVEHGHRHVTTYLNSGNVVFTPASPESADIPPAALAQELEAAFVRRFGFASPIVLRTGDEMAAVARSHPFAAIERDGVRLHVVFLAEDPDPSAVAALDPHRSPPDEYVVDGREIYVWYPTGAGRTKLSFDGLGTPATARNWKTVTKLAALSAMEPGDR